MNARSTAISISKLGAKNPQWKGDKVGIHAIHAYIKRHKPRPQHCEICKKVTTYPLDLANMYPTNQYTRDLNMYKYICRKCHMTTDGRINRFYSSQLQRQLQQAQVKARRIVKQRVKIGRCD